MKQLAHFAFFAAVCYVAIAKRQTRNKRGPAPDGQEKRNPMGGTINGMQKPGTQLAEIENNFGDSNNENIFPGDLPKMEGIDLPDNDKENDVLAFALRSMQLSGFESPIALIMTIVGVAKINLEKEGALQKDVRDLRNKFSGFKIDSCYEQEEVDMDNGVNELSPSKSNEGNPPPKQPHSQMPNHGDQTLTDETQKNQDDVFASAKKMEKEAKAKLALKDLTKPSEIDCKVKLFQCPIEVLEKDDKATYQKYKTMLKDLEKHVPESPAKTTCYPKWIKMVADPKNFNEKKYDDDHRKGSGESNGDGDDSGKAEKLEPASILLLCLSLVIANYFAT